jgi:glucose/arabinose dehydrogenase
MQYWNALIALCLLAISGLAGADETIESERHVFRVEIFAAGFGMPWGMAFLPDGRLLVTERVGHLRLVDQDGSVSAPIAGVPAVHSENQGGLMDVALHPQHAENGWIYLSYSDPLRGPVGGTLGYTAVSRGRLGEGGLVDVETIYRAQEHFYTRRSYHYGSRIVFDREGFLYFAIGDLGQRFLAQSVELPSGKIHRLRDDGNVPENNPFFGQEDAIESIWSYGHRNPQGLAVHPETGQLWSTEQGPKAGDELNWVRRGLNYGWPIISYGISYNGYPITSKTREEGMEQPQTYWAPSIGVCGIDFYTGERFEQWRHDLLVASLRFNRLYRVVLEGAEVVREEIVYQGESQIRDVQTGPDGLIYLAVEDPGRILRLVPAE